MQDTDTTETMELGDIKARLWELASEVRKGATSTQAARAELKHLKHQLNVARARRGGGGYTTYAQM